MANWALVVFFLGLLALVFELFHVFGWFTPYWGAILMFVAFGMLSRIWRKEKEGEKEKLVARIQELEEQLRKERGSI
jgi:uncharacterized membrane protein